MKMIVTARAYQQVFSLVKLIQTDRADVLLLVTVSALLPLMPHSLSSLLFCPLNLLNQTGQLLAWGSPWN